jgi:hypothetical protein
MKRIISFAIGVLAFAFYSTASQAEITSLTATSVTISKSTGLVTVNGTLQCTAGHIVEIVDLLNQTLGGKSGVAEGAVTGRCNGDIEPWSLVQNIMFFGSFQPGNAVAFVQGLDFTDQILTGLQQVHLPINPVP